MQDFVGVCSHPSLELGLKAFFFLFYFYVSFTVKNGNICDIEHCAYNIVGEVCSIFLLK